MGYAEVLQRNAVDLDLQRELTDQDLEKIGVDLPGHRKRLLKTIAELNGELAPTAPSRLASPEAYTRKRLAERILTSRSALDGEHKRVSVRPSTRVGSSRSTVPASVH
jgi:hypothetical protein